MEALTVYPKNQTELNALKSVLKDMNIKFEKFHTRNSKKNPFENAGPKPAKKLVKSKKENPKKGE